LAAKFHRRNYGEINARLSVRYISVGAKYHQYSAEVLW